MTDWSGRTTKFTYDLAGRVTGVNRPNGTSRNIVYDAAGQTTRIVEQKNDGTPVEFYKYVWDNSGRMQSEFGASTPTASTPPTRNMIYDADNRLTNIDGNTVTVDVDGNLTAGPLTNDWPCPGCVDRRSVIV